VSLQDLIKKYEAECNRKGGAVRSLYFIVQLYTDDRLQANRPIAAMEFLRELIAMSKKRIEFEE